MHSDRIVERNGGVSQIIEKVLKRRGFLMDDRNGWATNN
jgi:hypothetical protein